ncbi:hypothetical protein SALBM217S_09073 [Streptomyces griseoloalbus]
MKPGLGPDVKRKAPAKGSDIEELEPIQRRRWLMTLDTYNGDQWTVLLAPKAGTYRLAAPYKWGERGTPCPEELR